MLLLLLCLINSQYKTIQNNYSSATTGKILGPRVNLEMLSGFCLKTIPRLLTKIILSILTYLSTDDLLVSEQFWNILQVKRDQKKTSRKCFTSMSA